MLSVVLQAIKQKRKEQPNNKEIEDALQEAKNLQLAQAGLNAAAKKSAQDGAHSPGQARQGTRLVPPWKNKPARW